VAFISSSNCSAALAGWALPKSKVFAVTAVLCLGFAAFLHSTRKQTLNLKDATTLTLEKIDYGTKRPFHLDPWRQRFQWVIDHLPAWLSRILPHVGTSTGAWNGGDLPAPGGDALYLWLTRRDTRSGQYLDTGLHWAEIVDEHGCPFIAAQAGGISHNQGPSTRYDVAWFAFQAFPRRQKQFRLRLYDAPQNLVGEFVVRNPARASPALWKPQPLPITRRDGALVFILQSLSMRPDTNGAGSGRLQPPPLIAPAFEVSEQGKPTKEWEVVQTDLFDSLGNQPSVWPFKTPFLCPFEPAWKLRVKFCGKEISGVASNSCWTVRHLKLPSPGSFATLSMTQQVQGLTLRLIGLARAGHTSYSNDVPVRAQPLNGLEKEDYSETSMAAGSGGRIDTKEEIQMPVPHAALLVSGLTEDHRISVHVSDEQGRIFFAKIWEWDLPSGGFKQSNGFYLPFKRDSHYFLGFDIPSEVTELGLTVCVHRAPTVEFVVQPPRPSP